MDPKQETPKEVFTNDKLLRSSANKGSWLGFSRWRVAGGRDSRARKGNKLTLDKAFAVTCRKILRQKRFCLIL